MKDIQTLRRNIQWRVTILEKNAVLNVASLESLRILAEYAQPARLRKGAVLWHEGDAAVNLVCVIHGCLLVQQTDARGHMAYFHEQRMGALLGHSSLAVGPETQSQRPTRPVYATTIVAREETVVMHLPGSIVQEVMSKEPLLTCRLLWDLCAYVSVLIEDIFLQRTYSGKSLLAAKLIRLAAMESPHADSAYVCYSQAELSYFSGIGPRNVNKFLGELPALSTMSGRKGVRVESVAVLKAYLLAADDE